MQVKIWGFKKPSSMDPDYEQYGGRSTPSTHTSSDTDVNKIANLLDTHISAEIDGLEKDIFETDKRLHETRLILDRLRAAMLISFYKRAENKVTQPASRGIHPAVKPEIGKSIPNAKDFESFKAAAKGTSKGKVSGNGSNQSWWQSRYGNSQHRVIVGNVSKYIPVDMRQRNDQSTHKWMVYVRGPREHPDISHFVKSVWFFLHPTYKPNDLVEVTSPPFHLTRRGWGEFPVRVQLCLRDDKGRKVDIIHHLKLDRTYTGEQNLGAETHVDIQVQHERLEAPTSDLQPLVAADANTSTSVLDTTDTTTRHASPEKKTQTSGDCVLLAVVKPEPINGVAAVRPGDKRGIEGSMEGQPLSQRVKLEPQDEPSTDSIVYTRSPFTNGLNTDTAIELCSKSSSTKSTNHTSDVADTLDLRRPISIDPTSSTSHQTGVRADNSSSSQQSRYVIKLPTSSGDSRTIALKSVNAVQSKPKGVSLLRPFYSSVKDSSVRGNVQTAAPRNNGPSPNSLLRRSVVVTDRRSSEQSLLKSSLQTPAIVTPQPKRAQSFSGSAVARQTLSSADAASASSTSVDVHKTPLPVYVKCALPDGRVMLIRKQVIDETKQRQRSKDRMLNSSSVPDARGRVNAVKKGESTPPEGSQGLVAKACMPSISLIPDIQTLLSKLVLLYPLISTATAHQIDPALPSYDTYSNWPLAKRRAFEWQRAKRMQRHLVEFYDKFPDLRACTTKQLLLWCRGHLYSPCCDGDRLLPLANHVVAVPMEPKLKAIAKQLLSEDRKSSQWVVNEEVSVDVTAPAAGEVKVKEEVDACPFRVSVLADREDAFVTELVSQCGVKLGYTSLSGSLSANITSKVLHRLYTSFMEELIRRSHATKSDAGGEELLPADIQAAVRNNQMLEFLDQVFIDDQP